MKADPRSRAVLREAAAVFRVELRQIRGPRRLKAFVVARDAVTLVLRELGYSYPEIGDLFGRDHTTAIDGYRRALERMRTEEAFASRVRRVFEATCGEIEVIDRHRRDLFVARLIELGIRKDSIDA